MKIKKNSKNQTPLYEICKGYGFAYNNTEYIKLTDENSPYTDNNHIMVFDILENIMFQLPMDILVKKLILEIKIKNA